MAVTTVQELLDAGVHFGAPAHNWNPGMKKFIHGKRNKIHIINLVHTVRGLVQATHFLEEVAATGRQIVFCCTKRQMKGILLQEAKRAEMPWVTERWLGGTLTNFSTVRSRLTRLEELEAMEESGQMDAMKKKQQSMLNREGRRIKKNLDGLRTLSRIPGALLVVDPRREHIAVAEANRMGVPIIGILDTDCDPSPCDIPIPANDDSMRSIGLIMGRLGDAVGRGVKRFKESGLPPEDAVGKRRGDDVVAIKPEDMLASSGMADQVAAAASGDAPTGDAPKTEAAATAEAAPAAPAATEAAPAATEIASPEPAAAGTDAAPETKPEA